MNSCQKATYLISKKEEGILTERESLMLTLHLSVCSLCRSFEKQTRFFSAKRKDAVHHSYLSDVAKSQMKKNLQDAIDHPSH